MRDLSDKELIFKMQKQLKQPNSKKQAKKKNNPVKKKGKVPKKTFLLKNIQIANEYIKRCSTSLIIR